jgi:hypothetical protein
MAPCLDGLVTIYEAFEMALLALEPDARPGDVDLSQLYGRSRFRAAIASSVPPSHLSARS